MRPAGPTSFDQVDRGLRGNSDTLYGVKVRAEEPNEPKESQLDYSAKALQSPIPVSGLKTVGALVYRIGNLTKMELYADPRLEKKPLTIVGALPVPASDLLRALAFCVTATFRQVGPAFVLTDDLAGVGTRYQTWAEFTLYGDALRAQTVQDAERGLFAHHSPHDVSAFDNPLAYTADEQKLDPHTQGAALPEFPPQIAQPLSQFSPAQQDVLRQMSEKFNQAVQNNAVEGPPVSLDENIWMETSFTLQLLVPSLDGPVDIGFPVPPNVLFKMPENVRVQRLRARFAGHSFLPRPSPSPSGPPVTVAQALAVIPRRRAALVSAKTAVQVDADIAAMKTLGLNQLWLVVFADGQSRLAGKPDVLAEALAKTKGTGIHVFPVLDLLAWGADAPQEARDLNILGETSAQATARWQQLSALLEQGGQIMPDVNTTGGVLPDFLGVAACPQSPSVRQTLEALISSLTTRPGVAGLIWRDTDPPGYDVPGGGIEDSPLLLGYHESMRLAFLRKYHADPVDLLPSTMGYPIEADTSTPNFPTGGYEPGVSLAEGWREFRRDAGLALLRDLWHTANPPGTPPSQRHIIMVKQRRRGMASPGLSGHDVYQAGWYGTWENPNLPPPTLHTQNEDPTSGQNPGPPPDAQTQAATESRVFYTPLVGDDLAAFRAHPTTFRDEWRRHPAPGIVLDFTGASPGDDPLVTLAEAS